MNLKRLVLYAALAAAGTATATVPLLERIDRDSPALTAGAYDPVMNDAVFADAAGGALHIAGLEGARAAARIVVGTNPHSVVMNAVTGIAYLIDDGAPGVLVAVDVANRRVVRHAVMGNRPSHIAADFPRGELYIANREDATIAVVHAATLRGLALIEVSEDPASLSLDARRGLLYVTSERGTVDVIDLDYRQRAARVAVGGRPWRAAVDERSGKVYVGDRADGTVSIIDPATFAVARTLFLGAGLGEGTMSRIYPRYYLPSADTNALTIIDTEQDQVVGIVNVGSAPRQALLSGADDAVYVVNGDASVSVVGAHSEEVERTLQLAARPRLAIALQDQILTVSDAVLPKQAAFESVPVAPGETALATEYADAVNGRYLHAAHDFEVRAIADGLYGPAWRRTMRFHRVWTRPATGRVQVCEFSAAAGVVPSRRFAVADECHGLKSDSAWVDEGVAYYVALPRADGSCRAGTEPLYRVQRLGDGSFAQRFVRDAGVRDTLVSAGWSDDGTGASGTFACVPALRPAGGADWPIGFTEPRRGFERGLIGRQR